jgi:hypothetical protein
MMSPAPTHPAAAQAPQQRLVAERRWRLGVHARGHPSALMAELYRVLQFNGVAWKKVAPYVLKCRWAAPPACCQPAASLLPAGSISAAHRQLIGFHP